MDKPRPHSPAVYRRRRLAAALLGVFVLALVVWGARGLMDYFTDDAEPTSAAESAQQAQDEDDEESAEAEATETEPTESGSVAEDNAPGDGAAEEPEDGATEEDDVEAPDGTCAASDVAVRASTNQDEYDAGVAPLLILEVENTGSQACTLDVGTAEQTFAVAHAGREMFNTAQCGTEGESLEMEFEPGQTERAHLVWPRSDSGVDCSEPADVTTGDYELTVSVSGITSDPHTFHVTGASE
ncbi:hypothetical protein GCM10023354_01430 [Garicola koreensis]|uniref:hypothetical protein n=1 Tax=Garicola koreensis TaxID=1262554 RepID=UPI0031EA3619